jgi:cellulose synthase/poly-beta-1,6-N-acetylglucosamine synthase-like glycosyltransferase/peptidoglycan/xylan/chitin deacetylase (PgdA/CDA1 family)
MRGRAFIQFFVLAVIVLFPSASFATSVYQLSQSGRAEAFTLPPKTVVLTFDDGPTPYTDKILDILRQKHVRATFFVVGQNAVARPQLKAIVDQGHELGNHTYSHPDIANISPWRQRLELALGQLVITSQTGRSARLFRAPYQSSENSNIFAPQAMQRAGRQGYIVAGEDVDTSDWQLSYSEEIITKATGNLPGGVVLLHDGGGNRSKTVAALPDIIDRYQQAGFKFMPLGEAIGLSHDQIMPKVTGIHAVIAPIAGIIFAADGLVGHLAAGIIWLLIGIGLFRLAALLLTAVFHACRPTRRPVVVDVPCSVIIPAFNEERVIASCIRSVLASRYRRFEVIVVDDGSTDGTAGTAQQIDDPRVRVLSVPNGGKAAALNVGIRQARAETIIAIDADTVFQPDTLFNLCHHFKDPRVGAVAGNTRIVNRHNLLTKLQSLEYIVGFNLDRRMGDLFDCITVVPGAIGAFRKRVLVQAGGFRTDTLAEDTDITLSIKEMGYRIVYDELAVAYTEAPESVRELLKQRFRWTFGTMQAVWKHRSSIWNSRMGTLGWLGLPYLLVFQIIFPLVSPLFDLTVVVGLLSGNRELIVVSFGLYLVLDVLVAAIALVLDGEKLRHLWLIIPQRLIYRQLMYYVIAKAALNVLKGNLVGWGNLKREGSDLAEAIG